MVTTDGMSMEFFSKLGQACYTEYEKPRVVHIIIEHKIVRPITRIYKHKFENKSNNCVSNSNMWLAYLNTIYRNN